MEQPKGLIFDVQRFSIHDGPGIRTTVFLKGCSLSCAWCHNPESISGKVQIAFYKTKCIGCGRCVETCANGAIVDCEARIDRAACRVCGECADKCPTEAIQVIGRIVSVGEVADVVMRDEPFYKTSNGGVTLSGGEPLYQYEFSLALLQAFEANGLHTVVETCGLCSWDKLAALAALTDLFLYDIKAIDPTKHAKFCGADNHTMLDNARRLAAGSANIIFRAPIVPGLNDSASDLRLLGEFVLSLPGEHRLELMPYHSIGTGKYEALGMTYSLPNLGSADSLDKQKAFLISMGLNLVNA